MRHRVRREGRGVRQARRAHPARRAADGADHGGGRCFQPGDHLVQQPLRRPEAGTGAGILFSGHRDRRDAPPPDGQPAGAHRGADHRRPLRGRLPTDRWAFKQRHRPVCPPAAPPCRASARPAAAGDAPEIPPALQGRGRAGHPLPGERGSRLCGPAAAHLRRTAHFAAGHRPDEEPGQRRHRGTDAASRPAAVLGRAALLPHRGPAAGCDRDPDRHGGRAVHEPPAAGRCGQRQNAGGCSRHLGLHPQRLSGSAAGPHRDFGFPACREPEPDAGPVRDAGRPADRRHESRRPPHHAGRHPERRGRPRGGHPRHPQRGGRLCSAGSGRGGRTAPLRGAAAGPAGRKSREPPPAGHERHAHPPHTGAAPLRRPRHLDPRRTAAGPQAGQDPVHHREEAAGPLRLPGPGDQRRAAGVYRLPRHRGHPRRRAERREDLL